MKKVWYLFPVILVCNFAPAAAHAAITNSVTLGEVLSGRVAIFGTNFYSFVANSNDVLSLNVLKTNGAGSQHFRLHDPTGAFISGPTINGSLAYLASVRLAKTGTYVVAVSEVGNDQSYDYTLCTIKIPGPNFPDPGEGTELLTIGNTRIGEITPGDLDAYVFDVIAGDMVRTTVIRTSGSQFSPCFWASVFDPDGYIIDSIGNCVLGNPSFFLIPCATKTGRYTISCSEYLSSGREVGQRFTYSLILHQSPGPPPSYDPLHPYLATFHCMDNTVVRWPTNAEGFELVFATNVTSSVWSGIPPPYAVFANHFYVTNRNADAMGFYRLRQP
jgi:hypothetical protein